jgi:hypothetical protein
VRATPHATQGRHQEDQPPPPREIPLEPQPQINFQISLAPPMAAEFEFIASLIKKLSQKLTARKMPFEVYAPCMKEVLETANETYEKHVKNAYHKCCAISVKINFICLICWISNLFI